MPRPGNGLAGGRGTGARSDLVRQRRCARDGEAEGGDGQHQQHDPGSLSHRNLLKWVGVVSVLSLHRIDTHLHADFDAGFTREVELDELGLLERALATYRRRVQDEANSKLIEFPLMAGRPSYSLARIRRATGMTEAMFRGALAEELRWPCMSSAVLSALEAGHVEPTPDVVAAARRLLYRGMPARSGRRGCAGGARRELVQLDADACSAGAS